MAVVQVAPTRQRRGATRFYGRKTLEVLRLARDTGDIHEAIVNQLAKAGDDVTVTIEICQPTTVNTGPGDGESGAHRGPAG